MAAKKTASKAKRPAVSKLKKVAVPKAERVGFETVVAEYRREIAQLKEVLTKPKKYTTPHDEYRRAHASGLLDIAHGCVNKAESLLAQGDIDPAFRFKREALLLIARVQGALLLEKPKSHQEMMQDERHKANRKAKAAVQKQYLANPGKWPSRIDAARFFSDTIAKGRALAVIDRWLKEVDPKRKK